MDFGILTVFWYFGHLQFQNENASILQMKSAPRKTFKDHRAGPHAIGGRRKQKSHERKLGSKEGIQSESNVNHTAPVLSNDTGGEDGHRME